MDYIRVGEIKKHATWLRTDHTFKFPSLIQMRLNGENITPYHALFDMLDEEGKIALTRATYDQSFDRVEE